MNQKQFCKRFNITEDQFFGKEKIEMSLDLSSVTSIPDGFNPTVGRSLDLSSLTSIPDGFNPTVGGWLYLSSVTSIPDGFNPTVGGGLYLNSVTSIPDGFNPTVGGWLYLSSVTSIPDGFNPTVGESLYLNSVTSIPDGFNPTVGGSLDLSSVTSIPDGFNPTVGWSLDLSSLTSIPDGFKKSDYEQKYIPLMKWGKGIGTHILCDGRFSEVISKKGNVWKLKDVGKNNEYYLVQSGDKFAHGSTIKEAKEDLIYKISSRDKSIYQSIDKNEKRSFSDCITMYRVITGACSAGVRDFIEKNNIKKKSYSVNEILKITSSAYGGGQFREFFS